MATLADLIEEDEMVNSHHVMFRFMLDLLAGLNGRIADLTKRSHGALAMTTCRAG